VLIVSSKRVYGNQPATNLSISASRLPQARQKFIMQHLPLATVCIPPIESFRTVERR
jgi:hypothetical protein